MKIELNCTDVMFLVKIVIVCYYVDSNMCSSIYKALFITVNAKL